MTNGTSMEETEPEAPSRAQILKATGVAALAATVIFFTVVLPAELGKDPLHTGAALGLMNLSKPASAAGGGVAVTIDATPAAPVVEAGAAGEAPIVKGTFVEQPNGYKIDSRELKLGPGEGLEIKYHMQKGAGMVYSWTANNKVLYEFHGEPDAKPAGAPEDYFESYDKDDKQGKAQSHGSFTAPSTGIQGWFWDNESAGPITVKLVTAGFYDYILQNKDDVKTRLQPTEPK
jgi:hypothetical protein